MLGSSVIAQFEEDGFVVIKRACAEDIAQSWARTAKRIAARRLPKVSRHDIKPEHTRCWIDTDHPFVAEVASSPPLMSVCTSFELSPSIVRRCAISIKYPDSMKGLTAFPWHQDLHDGRNQEDRALCVYVSIEDTNELNGCLWVHPGSHKRGPLPHQEIGDGFWSLDMPVDSEGVSVPTEVGDLVLMHGHTVHRSMFNVTEKPRTSLYLLLVT